MKCVRLLAASLMALWILAACGGPEAAAPGREIDEVARARSEEVGEGAPPEASDLILLLALGLRAAPTSPAALAGQAPGDTKEEGASARCEVPTKLYLAYGVEGTIPPDPAPDRPTQGSGMSGQDCPEGSHWEDGQCTLDQPDDMTPPDPAPDDGA